MFSSSQHFPSRLADLWRRTCRRRKRPTAVTSFQSPEQRGGKEHGGEFRHRLSQAMKVSPKERSPVYSTNSWFTSLVFHPQTHNPSLTIRKPLTSSNERTFYRTAGLYSSSRRPEKPSQTRGAQGDRMTKCDVYPWWGPRTETGKGHWVKTKEIRIKNKTKTSPRVVWTVRSFLLSHNFRYRENSISTPSWRKTGRRAREEDDASHVDEGQRPCHIAVSPQISRKLKKQQETQYLGEKR